MNEPGASDPKAINPGGENPPGKLSEPNPATLEAANAAFEHHAESVSTPSQRRRGRPPIHGRYIGQGKSKSVPLAEMDNGSRPLLLEEGDPEAPQASIGPVPPAFDEKVQRENAAVIVGMMQSVNLFLKHGKLEKKISAELADFVIENKKEMPPEQRAGMERGLVLIARKYKIDLEKTPEALFGLALITWKMQDVAADKRLIAEYYRLRPQEVKAA